MAKADLTQSTTEQLGYRYPEKMLNSRTLAGTSPLEYNRNEDEEEEEEEVEEEELIAEVEATSSLLAPVGVANASFVFECRD